MLKSSFIVTVTMLAGLSAHAQVDQNYFTIGSVEVAPIVEQEFLSNPVAGAVDCSSLNNSSGKTFSRKYAFSSGLVDDVRNPLDPIDTFEMKLDQVINIGKKIWALVELGRPVVSVRADVATAMPTGAGCWTELQGWSRPESQSWGVTYKNLYGVEVVKHVYRVSYLPGGSVNGTGKYIGYATVLPVELNVAWGFKFSSEAQVPTVFNMGTKESPKAGMQINVSWKIETVLKNIQATDSYFVSGTGELQKMK